MKVESIVLGSIGTNCYIVTNEETKECFAVDMAECPQEYVNYIKNNGLEMKALFLTHGHFDHIMGIDDFLKAFPVPVYAGEDELPLPIPVSHRFASAESCTGHCRSGFGQSGRASRQ